MMDVLARAAERNMISAQTANQDPHHGQPVASEGEPLESAGEMIFSIPEAIAFFSRFVTLRAGDLLCMGTLGGVGATTAMYLKAGDLVEAEIEKLGKLINRVE
jgi:2-keto-4-pentenoate hydratase/2-oxohepta-3-ene-1,7-dioic acid hydratase in catechol pathway